MYKLRKAITKILVMGFIMTNILSAFPGVTIAASQKIKPAGLTDREKSQIIVKYNDDSQADTIRKSVSGKLKLKKLDLKKRSKRQRLDMLEIDKNDDVNKVIAELKKDKRVKYAQPNYPLQVNEVPSDPLFNKQWGMLNNGQSVEGLTGRSNVDVNALNAWNITQGSDTVVIGLLDTGVDINHLDLKDNIATGWDFVNGDATVYDDPGLDLHGTQVAGIIAAGANSTGMRGVAPNVKIMPLKFINGSVGYTCDAIDAIEYAMEHGVKIINCSFGGSDDNLALKDAMENSGILFVCSAGNRGADTNVSPVYPACFDISNVIAVAALDSKGVLANFSSYGSAIDVAAPGVNILSTAPGFDEKTYDYISGTSSATPFVTGIAALLKSYLPDLTISQIAGRIKNNVVPCTNLQGKVSSGGRVDAYAALTNTVPERDTYTGPGNDVDTVPPGQDGGAVDSWYTTDQLAKIKERIHYGDSGVNPGSGNFSFTVNDMSIPAPGFTVNISRTYNSKDDKPAPLGRGWTFGFEGSAKGSDLVTAILPTGAVERFRRNPDGTTYTSEDSRSVFVRNAADNTYILTTKDQYTYGFDSNGWLVWMKDRNGNTVSITVDAGGKVTKVTDTVGREYAVNYRADKPSLIDRVTDIENRTIKYEYDANDRLSVVTDPMGGKMYYEYDDKGFLNKIKDHNGIVVEAITYNHAEGENQHKVSQATDSLGCVVNYAYDMLNKKTTITDMNNRVSTYWFDSFMYTTKVQDPDGKSTLTEYYLEGGTNRYGDIISTTDRNGNRTEFNIDGKGNVIKKINFANNSSSEYGYDDKNNMVWKKDECGRYTYYIYDSGKINLLKEVRPLNGTDPYTDGVSSPSGYAITKYGYYTKAEAQALFNCGVSGLLKSVADPEDKAIGYTYDRDGNIKTVTDAENKTTSYEYNRLGWKTAETSAKGIRVQYTYDKNGQLEKTMNVTAGNTSRIIYNLLGQKIQEIRPGQYSAAEDDIAGHTYRNANAGYRYEYYDSGKLKKVTDPEGNITGSEYDCYGNLTAETRPDGSINRYYYDVMDRPVKTAFKDDAASAETILSETSYSTIENGQTQTTEKKYLNDAETAVTVYISDFEGRVVEKQNPDGTKARTAYNPDSTLNTATAVNGSTTYYKYDGLGRLSEQWTPCEVTGGNTVYTYTKTDYYKNGWKKTETAGKDRVALYQAAASLTVKNYTYNGNGKVRTVTDNEGRKTEYGYDDDGNVIREDVYTDALNKLTTEYVYNAIGKLQERKQHIRAGDIYGYSFSDNTDTLLTTTYTYDLDGNLKTAQNPNNVTTTYYYDSLGRQIRTSTPGQNEAGINENIEKSTAYNYEGKPLSTTDANGNVTNYAYNKRGFLTRVIDALGGVAAYNYDRAGRKTAEVSPANYSNTKTFNEMSRVEYIYDVMGRVKLKKDIYADPVTGQWVTLYSKAYKYDNSGNVIKELDAAGYDAGAGPTPDGKIDSGYGTEYTYDLTGKILTVTDAESKLRALPYTTKYAYDAIGRKVSETDAKGVITLYAYDDANSILSVKVKKNQAAAEQKIKTSTYDLAGRQTSQTDGNGVTVSYQNNAFGKAAKTTYPGDETISANTVICQYDAVGNLAVQTDGMGKADKHSYDNQGRLVSHIQQKTDGSQAVTVSFFRYDKEGNKRIEKDGNGNAKENLYDKLNRLTKEKVTASGIAHSTFYGYDANGNQTTVKDWRNNTSTNVYDPMNRVIEKRDPYGTVQKLEYYKNSLQSKSYDALNNLTIYSYDRNGRLLSTTDPEGHVTSQTYDDAGNVLTKTDGRGIVTTYNYDEHHRLKSVVNAKGEATSYTYDLNGNMLGQTDGKGNTTIYLYNVANKLKKKTDPGGAGSPGKAESYTYNADGSMKTKVDRDGRTEYYGYDIHGRLISQTIGADTISYTYDNNGNQLTMTDGTGTTTRTYDTINRVLTKQVPGIGTMGFQYDIVAGVEAGCTGEQATDPKGNTTLKVSDKAGRLYKVTADGSITTYAYYPTGSLKSVTYPSGAKEEYTYTRDSLLKELKNIKADGLVMDDYTYTYDAAHNQLTKTEVVNGVNKGTTAYTYDSLSRLETVTEPDRTTGYTYDSAGNRLTESVTSGGKTVVTTYTYNEQNRLLKTVTQSVDKTERVTYAYDNNGNMLAKDRSETASTPSGDMPSMAAYRLGKTTDNYSTIYRYDVWNQLTKTVEKDKTVTYTYNGEGYMAVKTVNGTLTRYLYEGDKVVLETDASGAQTARNVHGANLLSRTMGGQTAWYMYNGHADVTALVDTAGSILASYRYDAWGTVIEEHENVGVANPYRYAGYRYESETGLYYLNARYYDSTIARFLTEDTYSGDPSDPLSLNLYTYCFNNPIMYIDPTGNVSVSVNGNTIGNANINSNGSTTGNLTDIIRGLGGSTTWNGSTNTATVNIGGNSVSFNLDSVVNGTGTASDGTKFTVTNGKIQVGVRDISERVGNSSVTWDGSSQSVTVSTNDNQLVQNITGYNIPSTSVVSSIAGQYRQALKDTNNVSKKTDSTNTSTWIPSTIIDISGASDAAEYFNKYEKNFTKLDWNQDKVNELWKASTDIFKAYNIQIDPRLLLAIIIQEGTGSFNTSSTNKAADGQNGVETNYATDLMKANSLIFGKILGYVYYGEEFRQAVSNNNDKAGINGNGNILQYCNWSTPVIDTNKGKVRVGPYAGHGSWGDSVRKHYLSLGGDAEVYENYLSSIDKSTVEKIAKDLGIKLTSYNFEPLQNSQDSYGRKDGKWTVVGYPEK